MISGGDFIVLINKKYCKNKSSGQIFNVTFNYEEQIMVARSARSKVNMIRQDFIDGPVLAKELSQRIGLSIRTIYIYRVEFEVIREIYPDKLNDFKFRLVYNRFVKSNDPRYKPLIAMLPSLMDEITGFKIEINRLHKRYLLRCPEGYGIGRFMTHFVRWRKENNICLYTHRRVRVISDEDRKTLNEWKLSGIRHWKRATVLLGSFDKRKLKDLSLQVEQSERTIQRWIDHYKKNGLEGLIHKPAGINDEVRLRVKTLQENLMKLLHQPPSLYDINRTSWRMEDLAAVYRKVYGQPTSPQSLGWHLKLMGYGFRKSREVLTSPDPLFREKLDHIKSILSNLQPDEKFFSVDEMGPFAVKIKGGTSIGPLNEVKVILKHQRSKGFLIATAALELSTNQVTHFYSMTKDTAEMIKLLELLLEQYKDQSRIFFSWDAASWHASRKLYKRIAALNDEAYRKEHHTPLVELAPLPASSQFLNVIESVFSGLAKAVLHNSDYACLEDCKTAIDRHFKERNAHFLLHPKRAGNMIWGKERVPSVFDEVHNCKYNL